ncbi:MAG: DUF4342 domain-containing protein [Dethiobacter sp.]|jgi:hypothetical protein|nr:DUF4342 domain-containing protein [Dethiobacter sp.]MBS3899269.1 DUF4342 domain-containing protein [Dethiobacter sp.]MBS3982671.1 DUF4342 domain-containing protein [Dethiobacter sp.]MCL4464236.1 DUF4342 domain-containing protein [Bacillota bacterium]MCL5993327.1 DUF4342 domain-containing protein [Bacillota bacterium]
MEINLQQIDLIRERTGLNYAEARELLEEANGDVVEALIILDEEDREGEIRLGRSFELDKERMKEMVSDNLFSPVKKVLSQGNRTRIRISNQGGTLLEIPATLGIAGALLAPRVTALSAMALLMANYSMEVDAEDARN